MNRERLPRVGRRLAQALIGLSAAVALTAAALGPVPGRGPASRCLDAELPGGCGEQSAAGTGARGVEARDAASARCSTPAAVASGLLVPTGSEPARRAEADSPAPAPATAVDEAQRLSAWLDALRQAYGRGDVQGAQLLEAGLRGRAKAACMLRAALVRRLTHDADTLTDRFLFDLAERVFGGEDDPRALAQWHATLMELVRDPLPPSVRVRALSAVRWGVDAAHDADWTTRLLDLVRVESAPEVRIRAICVLGAKVPGAEATAAIASLAHSHPDPELRAAAAVALAHRDLPRACPEAALAALAGDPAPGVRRQVGAALEVTLLRADREDAGRVPASVAERVITALTECLEREGDVSVRMVLLRTLLSVGDESARLVAEDHLDQEVDPALRRGLAAALSFCSGWDGDATALRAALAERAPELFAAGK